MTKSTARCKDHDLAADADGKCVLCRREARAGVALAERETPKLPLLPIVLASAFGLFFVGGLVLTAFLVAGSDEGMSAEATPSEQNSASATAQVASTTAARSDVPIEVFSATWCPACRAAKQWLDSKGYAYTDHDIDREPSARTRLRTLNPRGSIPVIVVGGDRTLVGFDPNALEGAITSARPR